jgi:hypothetical protein
MRGRATAGVNHFTILETLADPQGVLAQAFLACSVIRHGLSRHLDGALSGLAARDDHDEH